VVTEQLGDHGAGRVLGGVAGLYAGNSVDSTVSNKHVNDQANCLVFISPSNRLPRGADIGPQAVFEGHHLVDTLAKHFEGATTAWDVTEQIVDRNDGWHLRRVVSAHAEAAIESVKQQGRRAHQAAKKTAWQEVPAGLAEQVTRFVDAVVNNRPVDVALDELGLEEGLR
jgi:hypothetical protein